MDKKKPSEISAPDPARATTAAPAEEHDRRYRELKQSTSVAPRGSGRPDRRLSAALRARKPLAALGAVALLLAVAGASTAAPRIVNGDYTSDWPSTGALLHNPSGTIEQASAGAWCSGTLIGCNTFLTAAHCVEDSTNARRYLVFLQHAGFFAVDSIVIEPGYTSGNWPARDVAIVHLAEPVEGIRPTPINTTNPNPFIPEAGTIVGFGRSGASDAGDDYGLKRVGGVDTITCPGGLGAGSSELMCWEYSGGVRGDASNTCNGDSGGPLFMDFGSGLVVAGVTSGGSSNECGPGDVSYDANVYTYASWIASEGGADLANTSCGAGAQIGDSQASVHSFNGSLSSGTSSRTHSFTAGGSVQRVVVTMNASEENGADFDMYVRFGAAPTTSVYDCAATGSGQFGACEFSSPSSGTWYVMVRRNSGNQPYQVTASVFSGDPPVCGDDVREGAEECDGSDDSACPGQCTGGCACPVPVCGDDVRAGLEECDGNDDSACPGRCGNDCTCPVPVCGDSILEGSEQCEVGDDSACPGLCDTDTCSCGVDPGSCNADDLFVYKLGTAGGKVKLAAEIDNFSGFYDGADPSSGGVGLYLDDGFGLVDVFVPGGSGWENSKPSQGKFKWKGNVSGIRKIKLTDRSANVGVWSVKIAGKDVPGAADVDPIYYYVDVAVTLDGMCAAGLY
jgi:hypothetical protein